METQVLQREKAMAYLRGAMKEQVEYALEYDDEFIDKSIKDLVEMYRAIRDNGWEWVAVIPCEMADSGIIIKQAEIKE